MRSRPRAWPSEVAAVVGEHLSGAQEAIEVDLLWGQPDEPPRPLVVGDGVVAEDEDPSARCSHETLAIPIIVVLQDPLGPSRPKKQPAGARR